MSDRWVEIQIETTPEAAEIVAAIAGDIAGGVEIRDADTLLAAGAGRAIVVVLVPPDDEERLAAAVDEALQTARAAGATVDPVALRRRAAHEDEWRDVWKTFFKATRVGRTFIVRPSWDPGGVADGDRVIDLDPGRAFGTGGHASTRLVIVLAERLAERGDKVARFLDLGCGSGILSIAAARLWPAARGVALDVDPEAVACTLENLARNGVGSVEARTATLAPSDGRFDVVLANIQADVLTPMAPVLWAATAPGGAAILSGLLVGDVEGVRAAMAAQGFTLEAHEMEGEWAGLLLARPAR